jgi:hypothetical protein
MGLDNKEDIKKIKSRYSAISTLVETKEKEIKKKKQERNEKIDKKKSEVTQKLKDLKEKKKGIENKIKNLAEDNLFTELVSLFKTTYRTKKDQALNSESVQELKGSFDNVKNYRTTRVLGNIFFQAVENTKGKISEILVTEIIDTLGCSEEQSYENVINESIYINLKSIDFFGVLKTSYDDQFGKYAYESTNTQNGTLPYSMNRQLYDRLQSAQSFSQQYGQSYIGGSNSQLMDIQYVDTYVNQFTQQTEYGDFLKITLLNQANGKTKISDFLRDYYSSIDIFSLDALMSNLINDILGCFDFVKKSTNEELTNFQIFILFIKRIMGICFDPSKKIDISGTAKLSDQDFIDDSFFEVSGQELININEKVERIINGLVTFDGCDDVNLPLNVSAASSLMDEIILENKGQKKVNKFFDGIENIANDPRWGELTDLDINGELLAEIIANFPIALIKTILSPKVMLGFIIMVKALVRNGLSFLGDLFEDITEFFKKFKRFIVQFSRRIISIFIEELFELIKKNIKLIVENIMLDIIKEAKNKQLQMYATIVYILFQVGQGIIDFRNCKSVIDEILKLLSLIPLNLNLGLPSFALAAADLLTGVSDTRSLANSIENAQKAGLPTDDNPDGTPNLMTQMMSSMIKGQNQEQAENGKTEVYIPPLKVVVPGLAGPGLTFATKTSGKSY